MTTLSVVGVQINILLLLFIGLAVGILSGFVGIGGGYLVTPALIILGLPANLAVGTSMAWIVGNSIVGTLRHRQMGNVDVKLGLVMIAGTVCGVEVGVRLLNQIKDGESASAIILSVLIVVLLVVGLPIFREVRGRKAQLDEILRSEGKLPPAMRSSSMGRRLQGLNIPPVINFAKSRVNLSLWVILSIAFVAGILAGFVGVGGGLIMLPSLIYLIGLPSFMAVGTGTFQIIFSASFGCVRHTTSGNVIILIAFLMLLGSSIGTQFGALITQYVRGISMRYVLIISILLCVVGSILKVADLVLAVPPPWLQKCAVVVIFGGIGLVVAIIIALFVLAIRYRHGLTVPAWVKALVSREEESQSV